MLPLEKCEKYLGLVFNKSLTHDLNPHLILAIMYKESMCELLSYRYEPKANYYVSCAAFAKKLNISVYTEVAMQKTSFGLMQVMGFKAREMGYNGHLPYILQNAELSIELGCLALKNFKSFWSYPLDMIAAYNAGSPRKNLGRYVNQKYVDDVKEYWAFLEKNIKF